MKVFVNGIEVSTQKDSFSMKDVIEERSTCSFTVVDINNEYQFDRGMSVRVDDEVRGINIFSGFVETSNEDNITGTKGLLHKINAVDNHYLADKRIIADAFIGKRAGDIFKTIVDDYLTIEGVTYINDTFHPTIVPDFTYTSEVLVSDLDEDGKSEDVSIRIRNSSSIVPTGADKQGFTIYSYTNPNGNTGSNYTQSAKLFNGIVDDGSSGATWYNNGDYIGVTFPSPERLDKFYLYWNYNNPTTDLNSWIIRGYNGTEWVVLNSTFNHDWYGSSVKVIEVPSSFKDMEFTQIRLDSAETGTYELGEFSILRQSQLSTDQMVEIVSSPISFDTLAISEYIRGHISWDSYVPVNSILQVETSLDNVNWYIERNGDEIESIKQSGLKDLTGQKLYVKIKLKANDVYSPSPTISNIQVKFVKVKGSIEPSDIIDSAVFNYIPISEALSSIAEQTNCWWKIDNNRVLHFGSRELYNAPFEIDSMKVLKGSVKVKRGNNEYRNQQYIIGGKDITDLQTEEFGGNGRQRTFTLAFPVYEVPTLYINDVKVDRVGIRGLSKPEDGYEWFWSKGTNIINQHDQAVPLDVDAVLKVEYKGEFDVVVVSRKTDEISRLSRLEGNSGYVENVREDKSVSTRDTGFKVASKILERYGQVGREISFKTHLDGLQSGQLLNVSFDVYGIEQEQVLIESVDITYETGKFFYSVKAIQNTVTETWTKFFYKISNQGRSYVIRENIGENEVLTTLEIFTKTWTESEVPNIFKILTPSDTTFPTATTYPTFSQEDQVKYIAWFNGETELGRKAITKQTWDENTKELTSIVYLSQTEANGLITHFGWFGGEGASMTKGSGILVDKQEFSKNKNELEALEIDKIDKKGW